MRSKVIATSLAVSANGTATSTPILLIAGGHFANYGDSNVPGEDMAFPSSGSAVVALVLEGVTLAATDTIVVKTSQNYFSDSGSGETFSAAATYTVPSGGISAINTTKFLDKVPLGEAVELVIVSSTSAGAGSVSAYLLAT